MLLQLLHNSAKTPSLSLLHIEQETSATPPEPVSAAEVQAQLDAEQAYQAGQGLVPYLHDLENPLLVITGTSDLVNPPSDQVSACRHS